MINLRLNKLFVVFGCMHRNPDIRFKELFSQIRILHYIIKTL